MAGRANAVTRHREAALFQTGKNGTINIRHDSRRADAGTGAPRHGPARLAEMRLGSRECRRAGQRQRRIGKNRLRLRLAERWPWAAGITAATARLQAIPSG